MTVAENRTSALPGLVFLRRASSRQQCAAPKGLTRREIAPKKLERARGRRLRRSIGKSLACRRHWLANGIQIDFRRLVVDQFQHLLLYCKQQTVFSRAS